MSCFTLLSLFGLLPLVCYCDISYLHDGPCPTPPPAVEIKSPNSLTGIWYVITSNYELVKESATEKRCSTEFNVTYIDGAFETENSYVDSNGSGILKKLFTPIDGQPGRYLANIPSVGGGWVSNVWIYTLVAYDDDVLLDYACKPVESKHKSFYRVFSRDPSRFKDKVSEMKLIANKYDDNREFTDYKNGHC